MVRYTNVRDGTYKEEMARHMRDPRNIAVGKCDLAAERGDIATIKQVFQTGQLDHTYVPQLLRRWFSSERLAAMRYLLELGADPNEPPLILIDKGCSLAKLKLLAEFGLDVKPEGRNIIGKFVGNKDILDWFLDQGVDVNSAPNEVWSEARAGGFDHTCTVLNEAAALGDIDLFDYLVSRGAEPARSPALYKAAKCKDPTKTVTMMTHLIEKYHYDVNADDTCGGLIDTGFAWHLSQGHALNRALVSNNMAAVKVLIKYGADPRIDYGRCNCPLSVAIYAKKDYGCDTILAVKLFLDAGANVTIGIDAAISANDLEAAQICLEYGADPVAAEEQGGDTATPNDVTPEMKDLLHEWAARRAERLELKPSRL